MAAVHQCLPCHFVCGRKCQVFSEQLVCNLIVDILATEDFVFVAGGRGGQGGKLVENVIRWHHGCSRLLVITREKGVGDGEGEGFLMDVGERRWKTVGPRGRIEA